MTSPAEETAGLAGRMVRGSAASLLSTVGARIIGAGAVVIVARAFSVDDFAAFSFGLAYATFFSTVSDLGLDTVIVRELAAKPDDRAEILGSAVVAKTVFVTAAAAIGAVSALLYDGDLQTAALVGSVAVLQLVAGTFGLTFLADLRLGAPAIIRLGGQIASWTIVAIVALADGGPLVALSAHVAVGFVPGVALAMLARRRRTHGIVVSRARVKDLVRASVPVASATFAIVIFARVDQLLLGAFGSTEDLATYGIVVRVVDLLNVVPIALSAVVLPAVSVIANADPARVRRLTVRGHRYLVAIAVPAAALATATGGPALTFVFGERYDNAGSTLALLAWAHVFAFAFLLARQVLIASDRAGDLARLAWVAAVLNVALNAVLIPAHGARGAAAASLVAYASPVVVTAVRRVDGHPFALAVGPISRAFVAGAALVAMLHLVGRIASWPVQVAVGVLAAPALLAAVGTIRRSDLDDVRRAIRPRPDDEVAS